MPQPRDSKGHFLPTPGSLKSRVIQLEAQVARQSEEIQNRTISQKKAEDRARDLFTELRLIASAAGVGGHAEERWPSEIKRVINQLIDQQSLTADELGAAMTEADELRAALRLANASLESLKTTNRVFEANTEAAYQDAMERERHAGWVETWAAAIVSGVVSGLAFYLIGRWGR